MPNTSPYELILTAPFTAYWAPVGTLFPDLSVAVSTIAAWKKIGTNGPLNYSRDTGVVVEHRQSVYNHRALGDAGVRKQSRTEADQILRILVEDLSAEVYSLALNNNEIRETGDVIRIGLSYGFDMATYALLVRGDISPEGPTAKMQYEVPIVSQQGSSIITYKNGAAAGHMLEWMTLVNAAADRPDKYFGEIVIGKEST